MLHVSMSTALRIISRFQTAAHKEDPERLVQDLSDALVTAQAKVGLVQALAQSLRAKERRLNVAKGAAMIATQMEKADDTINRALMILDDMTDLGTRVFSASDESNGLFSMRKPQAVKYLYKLIGRIPDGLFRDESWVPVHKIFSIFRQHNINYDIRNSDYVTDKEGRTKAKIWNIEIQFNNERGRPATIYGSITASGAGSIEEPLSIYDLTVVLG